VGWRVAGCHLRCRAGPEGELAPRLGTMALLYTPHRGLSLDVLLPVAVAAAPGRGGGGCRGSRGSVAAGILFSGRLLMAVPLVLAGRVSALDTESENWSAMLMTEVHLLGVETGPLRILFFC
jgi:hypothetical protein